MKAGSYNYNKKVGEVEKGMEVYADYPDEIRERRRKRRGENSVFWQSTTR